MPKILPYFPLLVLLLAAYGCSGEAPQASPRHIERLDLMSTDTVTPISSADSVTLAQWIAFAAGPDSTRRLYAESLPVRTFAPDIIAFLPPLDSVEQVLGNALANDTTVKLFGVISPYNQSILTVPGGNIYIGLNHYLGADYGGYRGAIPYFLRHRKDIKRMPIDVMQARFAEQYPPEFTSESTLLNRMLYQGALLLAVKRSLPIHTPESLLLGLTPADYESVKANEGFIWNQLINGQMLYSTSAEVSARLLNPSPASTLISADAPGQAALFTALKIAEAFSDNTGIAPTEILKQKLYLDNSTLIKSKYSPQYAN